MVVGQKNFMASSIFMMLDLKVRNYLGNGVLKRQKLDKVKSIGQKNQ